MNVETQTIKDFGEQWLKYSDNEGYYGSLELFSDILSPFIKPEQLRNCSVAEIGSGTGRIVNMLLESGATHVIALEPSDSFGALRPGGHFLVWLYGKEGNGLYLALTKPLRILTKRIPHFMLSFFVEIMYWPLVLYIKFCHWLPLPLRGYMLSILEKMSPEKRRLIIYDQLNPSYAKYYSQSEAEKILSDGGFVNIQTYHRHGYSWTVIGTKH